ncbi:MARVEL domain-containing protein 2-like [Porphyrio hochstetteri]
MRRAAGLSPEAEKRSSCRMCPRDPSGPQAAGSQWLSPPIPPEIQGCQVQRRVLGKYPAIRSRRQRESYKGVFQDQLAEYTELLQEVRASWRRLGELGAVMGQLPQHTGSRTDLAFLEKQQRCDYLKKKLTHIKARIQEYDSDTRHNAVS